MPFSCNCRKSVIRTLDDSINWVDKKRKGVSRIPEYIKRWIAVCTCFCLLITGTALTGFASGIEDSSEEPQTVQPETDPTEEDVQETFLDLTEATPYANDVINAVPLYLQTDYEDVPYGDGTIATSGCSMTCIAMVITYLTGREVTPDEVARRFSIPGASNVERMEYAALAYHLEFTKTFSQEDVITALSEGKVVIALMNSRSIFTENQHLVVLNGLLSEGNILVNDPQGYNYQRTELQNGFWNGFTRAQVFEGFSGAWIFEPYTPSDTDFVEYDPMTFEQVPAPIVGDVPLYLQTDYADVPYGGESVATSGCSMTCIAMVISYLTGTEVLPDAMANMLRKADGSHAQRMEAAALIYDLEFTKSFSPDEVMRALSAGKVVIALMDRQSIFTSTQHFIVLHKLLDDGRILVNDPLSANYRSAELKEGYSNGFTAEQVFTGFSGAWIFEPYTPPQVGPSQYPGVELTREETDLLAKLIWREARGECFMGQQAVAEVVLNRLVSGKFDQDNVVDLIMAPGQFNTAKFLDDTEADALQYKAIEKALNGPNYLPTTVYHFARSVNSDDIWGSIGNHTFY